MNRRPLRLSGSHHSQKGVALVVCLIFLLVLTLIGITAMRTTALEERMAGNVRNGEIAFQAAEAALREGEAWVMDEIDLYDPPDPVTSCSSTNPCDIWERGALVDDDEYLYRQDISWWQTTGREYGASTSEFTEAGEDPRYVVEYLGYDPGNTIINTNERARRKGPHFYRVTAAGFGGDTAAQRVLQTTVRINKN